MKQQQFEAKYRNEWQEFESQLELLETKKTSETDLTLFSKNYRKICYYLALAQERRYSPDMINRLNGIALRGHQQLYQHKSNVLHNILTFIISGFPQQIRQHANLIGLASALFYGPALIFGLLVYFNPSLMFSFQSPDQVADLVAMYNPANNAESAETRGSEQDLVMFGFYIRNNIGIGFQTFASGILFGLGSIFFLMFNGLALGGASGFLSSLEYNVPFYSFVITHGAFELTAITIAGAAGMKLGFSLLSPGKNSRKQALLNAGKESIQLVYGVIFFLLIAAFIEAFWSSSSTITSTIKFTVGGSLWALVFAYFYFGGRGTHQSSQPNQQKSTQKNDVHTEKR